MAQLTIINRTQARHGLLASLAQRLSRTPARRSRRKTGAMPFDPELHLNAQFTRLTTTPR